MPTPEEIRYSLARDKVDTVIRNSSANIRDNLKTLTQERTKILLSLISEWANRYQSQIRGFENAFDTANIQKKIGDAYYQYMKYSFVYRFLNRLDNNTKYHKIFSFEIHYFSKVGLLDLVNQQPLTDPSDDESLFYMSPLGHFLSYKLQKEYHVSPRNLTGIEDLAKFYDFLLDTVRTTFTDFFSQYNGHIIPLDSFRNFLNQSNNKNILAIFKRIEIRPFELI